MSPIDGFYVAPLPEHQVLDMMESTLETLQTIQAAEESDEVFYVDDLAEITDYLDAVEDMNDRLSNFLYGHPVSRGRRGV